MGHPSNNYNMKCRACGAADPGVPITTDGTCLWCAYDQLQSKFCVTERAIAFVENGLRAANENYEKERARADKAEGRMAGVRMLIALGNDFISQGPRAVLLRFHAIKEALDAPVEVVRVTVNDGGRLLRDGTCIGRVDLLMGYCDDGDTLLLVRRKP